MGSDPPHAWARLRSVAHEIAQAYQEIVRLGRDCLERREIAVNVGEHQRLHLPHLGRFHRRMLLRGS
jgi:hypothetical protein